MARLPESNQFWQQPHNVGFDLLEGSTMSLIAIRVYHCCQGHCLSHNMLHAVAAMTEIAAIAAAFERKAKEMAVHLHINKPSCTVGIRQPTFMKAILLSIPQS